MAADPPDRRRGAAIRAALPASFGKSGKSTWTEHFRSTLISAQSWSKCRVRQAYSRRRTGKTTHECCAGCVRASTLDAPYVACFAAVLEQGPTGVGCVKRTRADAPGKPHTNVAPGASARVRLTHPTMQRWPL